MKGAVPLVVLGFFFVAGISGRGNSQNVSDVVKKVEMASSLAEQIDAWRELSAKPWKNKVADNMTLRCLLVRGLRDDNKDVNSLAFAVLAQNYTFCKEIAKDVAPDVMRYLLKKNSLGTSANKFFVLYYKETLPVLTEAMNERPDDLTTLVIINLFIEIGRDARVATTCIEKAAKDPKYSKFKFSYVLATISPANSDAMDDLAKQFSAAANDDKLFFADVLVRDRRYAKMVVPALIHDLRKPYDPTRWRKTLFSLWEAGPAASEANGAIEKIFKESTGNRNEQMAAISAGILLNFDSMNEAALKFMIDRKSSLIASLEDPALSERYFACVMLAKLEIMEAIPALRKAQQ